jgi:hypothetical protein
VEKRDFVQWKAMGLGIYGWWVLAFELKKIERNNQTL